MCMCKYNFITLLCCGTLHNEIVAIQICAWHLIPIGMIITFTIITRELYPRCPKVQNLVTQKYTVGIA